MKNIILALFLLAPCTAIAEDDVVVKIDGDSITKAQIEKEFASVSAPSHGAAKWESLPEDVRASFIESYVKQYVLQKEADDAISSSDPRIEQILDKMRKNIRTQLYTEDKLNELVSDDELKGVYEDLLKHSKKPMIYQLLQVIAPSKAAADKARSIMTSGAPMAKATESDPSLKISDIELSSDDEIFPSVEKAISGLNPGGVSKVVKTDFGWHVFMLSNKYEGEYPPFEVLKPTIAEQIRPTVWQEYIDKVTKKASVHYYGIDGVEKPLSWNKK